MRRLPAAYLALLLCVSLLFSCSGKGKVIPREKLKAIYTEMFLADQWINDDMERFKAADSLSVYTPIFEKYGYDSLDFFVSVRHYMNTPEKFMKIFDEISAEFRELVDTLDHQEKHRDDDNLSLSYKDFGVTDFFSTLSISWFDSLSVRRDSLTGFYQFERHYPPVGFAGPRVIDPLDTAALKNILTEEPTGKKPLLKGEPLTVRLKGTQSKRLEMDEDQPLSSDDVPVAPPRHKSQPLVPEKARKISR